MTQQRLHCLTKHGLGFPPLVRRGLMKGSRQCLQKDDNARRLRCRPAPGFLPTLPSTPQSTRRHPGSSSRTRHQREASTDKSAKEATTSTPFTPASPTSAPPQSQVGRQARPPRPEKRARPAVHAARPHDAIGECHQALRSWPVEPRSGPKVQIGPLSSTAPDEPPTVLWLAEALHQQPPLH
jgi:hypothetical protein